MARSRVPNARLRALVEETGWTQAGLARAVNAVGRESGLRLAYDRTSVAHWLTGSRPADRVVLLVCEALSRRTGRVVVPEEAGFAPVAGRMPEQGSGAGRVPRQRSGTGDRQLAELVRDVAAFTPYRPAATSALAVEEAAPGAGPVTGAAHGSVTFFAQAFLAQGGGFARTTLRTYLSEAVARQLREARGPGRAVLSTEAAQLALLLGRMYADDLQHGAAQRCYLAAWNLAATAGHRESAVIAVRTLSAQAHQLGHREVADAAARAAVRAADGVPCALRAFARAQLAVTAASRGDGRAALRSLLLAEGGVSDPGDGPMRPFETYARGDFEYQRAETLLALGRPQEAVRALEHALTARPPDDRRGTALTRLRLAGVLLSLGRAEESHAQLRIVREDFPTLRSATLTRTADSLTRALTRVTTRRTAPAGR
ncbi:hypothetical protein [Streptomyces sp. 4F14]|uniref:tetratricopeptide repeat protein n=1 Tax=Streptomyces sp. 4F14 TaxID=3394380 RepID=UPI003A89BBF0